VCLQQTHTHGSRANSFKVAQQQQPPHNVMTQPASNAWKTSIKLMYRRCFAHAVIRRLKRICNPRAIPHSNHLPNQLQGRLLQEPSWCQLLKGHPLLSPTQEHILPTVQQQRRPSTSQAMQHGHRSGCCPCSDCPRCPHMQRSTQLKILHSICAKKTGRSASSTLPRHNT
jgi:hypothetical protein